MLSGCSTIIGDNTADFSGMYQNATFTPPAPAALPLGFKDYVRELAADLTTNMRSVESSNTIVVTNFVVSDSDFQSTNQLGNVLADTFMMELHQLGFETLDVKVTDYVRVTEQGDFGMSRDYQELKEDIAISYMLVGKFTEHEKGYIVHARIVDIKTKKILAAGESFIPRKLVKKLLSKRFIQSTNSISGALS